MNEMRFGLNPRPEDLQIPPNRISFKNLLNRSFLGHFWENMYPVHAGRPGLDLGLRGLLRNGSVPLRDGARMLGARCHEARILEARILGYWRLGYWRLGGYKACRPRLGGLG